MFIKAQRPKVEKTVYVERVATALSTRFEKSECRNRRRDFRDVDEAYRSHGSAAVPLRGIARNRYVGLHSAGPDCSASTDCDSGAYANPRAYADRYIYAYSNADAYCDSGSVQAERGAACGAQQGQRRRARGS